jgi:DNA-directed RNA polymerase specialized sigma24 family protein
MLHDLEGLPIEEIAAIVEANPLTVRSRLRDGRKDLARPLADDPFFGDEVCRSGEHER